MHTGQAWLQNCLAGCILAYTPSTRCFILPNMDESQIVPQPSHTQVNSSPSQLGSILTQNNLVPRKLCPKTTWPQVNM